MKGRLHPKVASFKAKNLPLRTDGRQPSGMTILRAVRTEPTFDPLRPCLCPPSSTNSDPVPASSWSADSGLERTPRHLLRALPPHTGLDRVPAPMARRGRRNPRTRLSQSSVAGSSGRVPFDTNSKLSFVPQKYVKERGILQRAAGMTR